MRTGETALSPRLLCIGNLIPPGARVADVGTDHGYLPVWLVSTGRSPRVIATDLREGPLAAARRSASARGVGGRIEFRLADGLGAVSPEEVDAVVIAGMGGETICRIIGAAPWLGEGRHSLIIQPQSKLPETVDRLHALGYAAEDQFLVMDGGVIYTIYKVRPGAGAGPEGADRYIHPALVRRGDPLLGPYLDGLRQKLRRALAGLELAGEESEDRRAAFARELEELERLKGEIADERDYRAGQ